AMQRTTRRHASGTQRRSKRPTSAAPRRPARQAAASPLQAPVNDLLDKLSRALVAGDGETCAECFEYPSFMAMPNSPNRILLEASEVAGFFGGAFQQYNAKGIYDTVA